MGFFKKTFDFIARPSNSRTMSIVLILTLVVGISLTVNATQQTQQLKQLASENIQTTTPTRAPTSPPTLVFGDINKDGKIDVLDYNLLKSCYGKVADACPGMTTLSDFNNFIKRWTTWNKEGQ